METLIGGTLAVRHGLTIVLSGRAIPSKGGMAVT